MPSQLSARGRRESTVRQPPPPRSLRGPRSPQQPHLQTLKRNGGLHLRSQRAQVPAVRLRSCGVSGALLVRRTNLHHVGGKSRQSAGAGGQCPVPSRGHCVCPRGARAGLSLRSRLPPVHQSLTTGAERCAGAELSPPGAPDQKPTHTATGTLADLFSCSPSAPRRQAGPALEVTRHRRLRSGSSPSQPERGCCP